MGDIRRCFADIGVLGVFDARACGAMFENSIIDSIAVGGGEAVGSSKDRVHD